MSPPNAVIALEAYREEVHRVVDAADRLLATKAPPEALRLWIERLAQYAVTKHGLGGDLRVATFQDPAQFSETYDLLAGALSRLLSAAADVGVIRPGLDPDDVLLALAGFGRSTHPRTGGLARKRSTRWSSTDCARSPAATPLTTCWP